MRRAKEVERKGMLRCTYVRQERFYHPVMWKWSSCDRLFDYRTQPTFWKFWIPNQTPFRAVPVYRDPPEDELSPREAFPRDPMLLCGASIHAGIRVVEGPLYAGVLDPASNAWFLLYGVRELGFQCGVWDWVNVVRKKSNRMGWGEKGHLHLRRTFLIHLRKDLRFGFHHLELVSGHHYFLALFPKRECDRLNM